MSCLISILFMLYIYATYCLGGVKVFVISRLNNLCHIAILCMTLRIHTTDNISIGVCLLICGCHTYGATDSQGHILYTMVTVDSGSAYSRCGCRSHRDVKS